MSHVVTGGFVIQDGDLGTLEEAAAEIGLELVRDRKRYRWYGQWVDDYHDEDAAFHKGINPEDYGKCEHVLRVADKKTQKTAYEIGLVKNPNTEVGGYVMIYDFYGAYGQQLENVAGKHCANLTERFVTRLIEKKIGKNRKVERVTREDGKIEARIYARY